MATCATCGRRSAPSTKATSPAANTVGKPGTWSVGATQRRPLRPVGSPSRAATGAARMPAAELDVIPGHALDAAAGAHLDAERLEVAARALSQLGRVGREHVLSRLED